MVKANANEVILKFIGSLILQGHIRIGCPFQFGEHFPEFFFLSGFLCGLFRMDAFAKELEVIFQRNGAAKAKRLLFPTANKAPISKSLQPITSIFILVRFVARQIFGKLARFDQLITPQAKTRTAADVQQFSGVQKWPEFCESCAFILDFTDKAAQL